MARTTFILAIWLLAASLGIFGYQGLTWFFYQHWPTVSIVNGWQAVRGAYYDTLEIPAPAFHDELGWIGGLPLVPAGIILSYAFFLLSDTLRGRFNRLST